MSNIRKNLTGSRLLAWVTTIMGFILGCYMAYREAYNEGSFTFLGPVGQLLLCATSNTKHARARNKKIRDEKL